MGAGGCTLVHTEPIVERRELWHQASDEAPLTFCDVAACFSDEEWELLQRWQKELYKNVMKEIQLAFSSLGPLIANSVFSLRPKEKEDLCSEELQDVEKSINVDPSTNHMTADSDVLFIGNQFVKDTRVTAVKEQGDSPSTDIASVVSLKVKTEEESYSARHADCERRESAPSGAKLGVVTGGSPDGINADGETRSTAIQAYRTRESWSSLSGNGSMKRNMSNSFKYHEKPTIFKSLAQKRKVNMAQSVYEKTHSNSQMPPASSQEQRGEKSAEWQRKQTGYGSNKEAKFDTVLTRTRTPEVRHMMGPILGYLATEIPPDTQSAYNHPITICSNYRDEERSVDTLSSQNMKA
ncbi:hypothetical protein NDU88_007766 [Pleurodeles waltl]|uniref:KRAB domain-containing protein n=1 Tax=Pleurodeles waltl TaxID=8319 RepID=A0AAV7STB6_PLEWA|nr:hypothetical protein NDU88_007766 [Pleurodeles waltl]